MTRKKIRKRALVRVHLLPVVVLTAVLSTASPADAHAAVGTEVTSIAPAGTVAAWIDVHHSDLTPDNTRLEVRASDGARPADVRATTFGVTTIVELGVGDVALQIDADARLDADVAFTYVDAAGTVLGSQSARIPIGPGVDPTTKPVVPGDGADTADAAAHNQKRGGLPSTGWTLPLGLLAAAIISVMAGVAMRARRLGAGA